MEKKTVARHPQYLVPVEKAETQLSTLSDFSSNLSVDLLFVCHIILRRLLIYQAVISSRSSQATHRFEQGNIPTLFSTSYILLSSYLFHPVLSLHPLNIGFVVLTVAERLNILFLDSRARLCGEDVRYQFTYAERDWKAILSHRCSVLFVQVYGSNARVCVRDREKFSMPFIRCNHPPLLLDSSVYHRKSFGDAS